MIETACALQKHESHVAAWPWRGYATKYDRKKSSLVFEDEEGPNSSLISLKNLVSCCIVCPLKLSEYERDMFRRYKKLLKDDENKKGWRFECLDEEEGAVEGEVEDEMMGSEMTESELETLLSAVDVSYIPSLVLLFQVPSPFSSPLLLLIAPQTGSTAISAPKYEPTQCSVPCSSPRQVLMKMMKK